MTVMTVDVCIDGVLCRAIVDDAQDPITVSAPQRVKAAR